MKNKRDTITGCIVGSLVIALFVASYIKDYRNHQANIELKQKYESILNQFYRQCMYNERGDSYCTCIVKRVPQVLGVVDFINAAQTYPDEMNEANVLARVSEEKQDACIRAIMECDPVLKNFVMSK